MATYDKFISIACLGYELTNLRGVTKTKVAEEIDSDLVKTWDDPIPVPASDGGYTIDVNVIETRNVEDFITYFYRRFWRTFRVEPNSVRRICCHFIQAQ